MLYIPASFFIWIQEWWKDWQTSKEPAYLPLQWQALMNHCYLPPVACTAFVLRTMRAFLRDGCRQFVSCGVAGVWGAEHTISWWTWTESPLPTCLWLKILIFLKWATDFLYRVKAMFAVANTESKPKLEVVPFLIHNTAPSTLPIWFSLQTQSCKACCCNADEMKFSETEAFAWNVWNVWSRRVRSAPIDVWHFQWQTNTHSPRRWSRCRNKEDYK